MTKMNTSIMKQTSRARCTGPLSPVGFPDLPHPKLLLWVAQHGIMVITVSHGGIGRPPTHSVFNVLTVT